MNAVALTAPIGPGGIAASREWRPSSNPRGRGAPPRHHQLIVQNLTGNQAHPSKIHMCPCVGSGPARQVRSDTYIAKEIAVIDSASCLCWTGHSRCQRTACPSDREDESWYSRSVICFERCQRCLFEPSKPTMCLTCAVGYTGMSPNAGNSFEGNNLSPRSRALSSMATR